MLGGRIKVEKFDESDNFNDIKDKEAKVNFKKKNFLISMIVFKDKTIGKR